MALNYTLTKYHIFQVVWLSTIFLKTWNLKVYIVVPNNGQNNNYIEDENGITVKDKILKHLIIEIYMYKFSSRVGRQSYNFLTNRDTRAIKLTII